MFCTMPLRRVTRSRYRPDGMSEVLTVVCGDGRDARPCVSAETGRPNMSNISMCAIFALPPVTATCNISSVGLGCTVMFCWPVNVGDSAAGGMVVVSNARVSILGIILC